MDPAGAGKHAMRLAPGDASLVTCGGDGGNRTRVRRIRPGTSTSLVGLCSLVRGVAADRATPELSRWEPKLPLEYSYRRRSAARRLFYARPLARRRETRADVTVCTVSLSLGRIRLPLGQRQSRPAGRQVLLALWSVCSVVNGGRAPRLAIRDQPSPSKPVIPTFLNIIIARVCHIDKVHFKLRCNALTMIFRCSQ